MPESPIAIAARVGMIPAQPGKLWVVTASEYDDTGVLGICRSVEGAKALALRDLHPRGGKGTLRWRWEDGVAEAFARRRRYGGTLYSIFEMEVKD